jgi:hypothetical protein
MGFCSLIELKMKKTDPLYPYVQEILLGPEGRGPERSILASAVCSPRPCSGGHEPDDTVSCRLFRMLITRISTFLFIDVGAPWYGDSQIVRILFNLVTNA